MRTCSDCGEALSVLTQPCPACGSSRQSASVRATAAAGVAAVLQPGGVSLTFNPDQPWYTQWHKVRQSLKIVEDACLPETYPGSNAVQHATETFLPTALIWVTGSGMTHQLA
jgi:hypothetical protein